MLFAAILLLCPCAQFVDGAKTDANVPALAALATSENSTISSELPSMPDAKFAADPAPTTIIPRSTPLPSPAARGFFMRSMEAPKEKKLWYALSISGHSGAAFDAWSTRRALSASHGVESNPMLKPFANSNAIYAATQVTPLLLDFVGHRMMYNKRNWVRKIWWVPQAAGSSVSFGAAIHNVRMTR